MHNLRRWALAIGISVGAAWGQPALTTIQDTLYRADGSRFSGTMFITWSSFQAGDTSNIATANLTLPIINGVLKVQLVPTTTASAGAQYQIKYNSKGITQFTETWAVPPSRVTLRVRDVRVGAGTVVGPPPVTSPVEISDVTGLDNELAVRPMKGVGFGAGRAAVINSAGQIDAAAGNLDDCVHVDGSAGPCGSGGSGGGTADFVDGEVPAGAINGTNTVFTLTSTPAPSSSLALFRNGLLMRQGSDYSISGTTVTFYVNSKPQTGDLLTANYRYAAGVGALTALAPQVLCSTGGNSVSGSTQVHLGGCTIPAGVLADGDRIEVQFHFSHAGTSAGFLGAVKFGGTTVVSRTGSAGEAVLVGRATFGISALNQVWDSQSWGSSSSLETRTGITNESITQGIAVDLRGQLDGATGDNLTLSNFTVLRYPAQGN